MDCREDDYAWCNTNPDGELIPSVSFEREMRGGLDDYRYLLTLSRLARQRARRGRPVADRPSVWPPSSSASAITTPSFRFPIGARFRRRMADAIARLRNKDQ